MLVKASAPGKVFLIGEHAVVYGKPAMLAAIDRRVNVTAETANVIRISDPGAKESIELSLEEMSRMRNRLHDLWKSGLQKKDFSQLFGFLKGESYKFKVGVIAETMETFEIDGGISIDVTGNIPRGSGLGTSAAVAVAIAQAVAAAYDIEASADVISDIAYRGERFAHGTPSGSDTAASAYGGLVWFQKGEPNTILPLNLRYELENFVLVNTPGSKIVTGDLVQSVRDLPEAFRTERIGNIADATYKMRDALEAREFEKMKKMMNLAQKNLKEMGVSTSEIDRIAQKVVTLGGSAKLCGAGGGGTVLCYHEDQDLLKREIHKLGYEVMNVRLGVAGVRLE